MANFATNGEFEEAFWKTPLALPPGLKLQRRHTYWTSQRPGPGGSSHFELATLHATNTEAPLLIAYRPSLLAKDVPGLKKRMTQLLEERRRSADEDDDRERRFPIVATDRAQPAVREACVREWLGLIDQTGTVMLHDGPVYVHVEGQGKVKPRTRATLFRGRGARVLRFLLDTPGTPHPVAEVARRTDTSTAYAFAVLTRLEEDGYVQRRSPRSGFRLIRPVELLKAWLDAQPRQTTQVEPFYAPFTAPDVFDRMAQRLIELKAPFAQTLMSAVSAADVLTGALPHGLYLGGDLKPVVELLGLKRTTPHNFLVLRPEPDAATEAYGVFRRGKRTVSEPQLVLDLVAHGGVRGREQADVVLRRWAASLPIVDADD